MTDNSALFNCTVCEYQETCLMNLVSNEIKSSKMYTDRIRYLRRQTICKEGEFSSGIKLILEGYVKVMLEGPEKKNLIIKILKPGDFVGVSAICDDALYNFSAMALTDALVCSINKDLVTELIMAKGKFSFELAKWYCSNNNLMLDKLKTIRFKNLHGRMADCLIYLDNKEFKKDNLYKYLSRRDIAELAGTPMESAVRILSEFSDSNIIRMKGKEIEILDTDMLTRISRGG